MLILAMSGSLRRDSHNTRLLRAATGRLPADVRVRLWDELAAIAPFNEDDESAPPAPVRRLRDAIAGADGLLISTPEYNASFPGQLKNALDWVSRPYETNALRNVPVAVLGASTGPFGAVWAQADLRRVLSTIGAVVIGEEFPVGLAAAAFTASGDLRDPDAGGALSALMSELAAAARPVTCV
jgi:chromate reductase, NAD(P)H dehydrogenase (quinone)